MQEDTEMTFLGLHGAEIRVKFFDNVWSVFNGLFCHVALPLPEAKLEKNYTYLYVFKAQLDW